MGDFIKKYSDISDPVETAGVLGTSTIYYGVLGYTTADGQAGVAGVCNEGNGNGLYGSSTNSNGVYGQSSAKFRSGVTGVNDNESEEAGPGVYGKSRAAGVLGESETQHGVAGISESTTGGAGIYGKGDIAALFEGFVYIEKGSLIIRGKSILKLVSDLENRVHELERKLYSPALLTEIDKARQDFVDL